MRLLNTMIYSRKAYTGTAKSEKEFALNVEKTSEIANSLEEHIKLLEKIYPNYTLIPLYTYEHTNMKIERQPTCRFDSSLDAFAAFKNEKEFEKKLEKINKKLEEY